MSRLLAPSLADTSLPAPFQRFPEHYEHAPRLRFRRVDDVGLEAYDELRTRLRDNLPFMLPLGSETRAHRCHFFAFPKSGSSWAHAQLKTLIGKERAANSAHHCFPAPNALALAHKEPWASFLKTMHDCVIEHLPHPDDRLVILHRLPYDQIVSRAFHGSFDPYALYQFGIDVFKYGITTAVDLTERIHDESNEVVRLMLLDFAKKHEVFAILRWHHALQVVARQLQRDAITVGYEQLVTQQRSELHRLMSFCGATSSTDLDRVVTQFAADPRAKTWKYRRLFADEEVLWLASVVKYWDPETVPWSVGGAWDSPSTQQWATHERNLGVVRHDGWWQYCRSEEGVTDRQGRHISQQTCVERFLNQPTYYTPAIVAINATRS